MLFRSGGGSGEGTICGDAELDRRTTRLGREEAIASCSVGTLGHGGGSGTLAPNMGLGSCGGNGGRCLPGRRSGRPVGRCGPDCVDVIHGALGRDVIRGVVARHRPEVRFCYETGLERNPGLAGRVSVQFVIGVDGRVSAAAIDSARSDLGSRPVEQCVAQAVARWTFPTSAAPTAVSYPFVLDTE